MKIAIIGIGKMGYLFAKYFLYNGYELYVYDKDSSKINKIVKEGAKSITLKELNIMDLVMVAVPLEHTLNVIDEIVPYMKKNSYLLEITSIKHHIVKRLRTIYEAYNVKPISIHPLFGQGLKSFKGARIIFIPIVNEEDEYEYTKQLFSTSTIIKMDVEEHDRFMAITLGLVHLINLILCKILTKEDYLRLKEVGGTTYRLQIILTESIMMSEPDLVTSILLLNPYMKKYIDIFIEEVNKICKLIIDNKRDALLTLYKEVKEEVTKKSNIEVSYETMYNILEKIV